MICWVLRKDRDYTKDKIKEDTNRWEVSTKQESIFSHLAQRELTADVCIQQGRDQSSQSRQQLLM